MTERTQKRLLAALLVALVVAVYSGVLGCGYIWDDDSYVTRNPLLRSLEGLRLIWFDPFSTPQYYPLVHTSYWIEFRIWALSASGYHLVNVLLHGLAAVLLWRVLDRLRVPGSWTAAAVFALHPVQVESVAWITERKNVLSAAFYFASALVYLGYLGRPDVAAPGDGGTSASIAARSRAAASRWRWWISLALFICALLSKTVTSTLPAALLLLVWWKRGRIRRSDVVPLVPFFILGLAFGLLTVWLERDLVGASGSAWQLSLVDRCLLAGRILCFYVGKLLWPHPLSFVYERWNVDAGVWWQYLFPIAALGGLLALWFARGRIGRGPFAAASIFAGTLFPSLGFFNVYPMRFSWVADHFQYHASAAMIALLVAAAAGAAVRSATGLRMRATKPVVLATTIVLATLSVLTWRQIPQYQDAESLWQETRNRNPKAWLAIYSLGEVRRSQGRTSEARTLYQEALAVNPGLGTAHAALGLLQASEGNLAGAVEALREAIRLDPNETTALLQLAAIYAGEDPAWQHPGEAIELAEHASRLTKDRNPWILSTLTVAYARAGRLADAARTAERARDRALLAGDRGLADINAARLAQLRQFLDKERPAEGE